MRFLPVNLNALLVELDNLEQTLALLASLKNEPIAGIEELVPAAHDSDQLASDRLQQGRPGARDRAA